MKIIRINFGWELWIHGKYSGKYDCIEDMLEYVYNLNRVEAPSPQLELLE